MKQINKTSPLKLTILLTVVGLAFINTGCGSPSGTVGAAQAKSLDDSGRDQYGRISANYAYYVNTCLGTVYDLVSGQFLDSVTGLAATCNSVGFDGYNALPFEGVDAKDEIHGCSDWEREKGVAYLEVDLGNGLSICANRGYLEQHHVVAAGEGAAYACKGEDCTENMHYTCVFDGIGTLANIGIMGLCVPK